MPTYAYKMSKHFKKRAGGRKTNKKNGTSITNLMWRDSLVCLRERMQRDAHRSKSASSVTGERRAAELETTLDLRATTKSAPICRADNECPVDTDEWARFVNELAHTDWTSEEERAAEQAREEDWLAFVATPPADVSVTVEQPTSESETAGEDYETIDCEMPVVSRSVTDWLAREEWTAQQSVSELRVFLNTMLDLGVGNMGRLAQEPTTTVQATSPSDDEFTDWTFWMPPVEDIPGNADQPLDWTNFLPAIESVEDAEQSDEWAADHPKSMALPSYSMESVLEYEHFGICGCSKACFEDPSEMSTKSSDHSIETLSEHQGWKKEADEWFEMMAAIPITDWVNEEERAAEQAVDQVAADWTDFLDDVVNSSATEANRMRAEEYEEERAAEQQWSHVSTDWLSIMTDLVEVFANDDCTDPGPGVSGQKVLTVSEMMAVSSPISGSFSPSLFCESVSGSDCLTQSCQESSDEQFYSECSSDLASSYLDSSDLNISDVDSSDIKTNDSDFWNSPIDIVKIQLRMGKFNDKVLDAAKEHRKRFGK